MNQELQLQVRILALKRKNDTEISIPTLMQPSQYNLQCPAAKDCIRAQQHESTSMQPWNFDHVDLRGKVAHPNLVIRAWKNMTV